MFPESLGRVVGRVCLVLSLALACGTVFAQATASSGQCSLFSIGAGGYSMRSATLAGACQQFVGKTMGSWGGVNGMLVTRAYLGGTGLGTCELGGTQSSCNGTGPHGEAHWCGDTASGGQSQIGVPCNNACSNMVGQKTTLTGSGTQPAHVCESGSMCSVILAAGGYAMQEGGGAWIADYAYTGEACTTDGPLLTSDGDSVAPANLYPPSDCDSSGTICKDTAGGNNCGTLNGDEVCVGSVPPGSCVSYASGGVACVGSGGGSPASPPAPDNGTAGHPATPTATASAGNEPHVNYYGPSVVSGSHSAPTTGNPIQPQPTGTQGISGGGGGGGSGTVSVSGTVVTSNAQATADGDCSANDCSGGAGGGLPGDSWSGDCADVKSCFQGFYSAAAAAPIVQGAVAIETAWPTGTCDIGSVSLQTFNNHTFDFGAQACAVWNNYISSPLSIILLVVYAVAGVFIVLTA